MQKREYQRPKSQARLEQRPALFPMGANQMPLESLQAGQERSSLFCYSTQNWHPRDMPPPISSIAIMTSSLVLPCSPCMSLFTTSCKISHDSVMFKAAGYLYFLRRRTQHSFSSWIHHLSTSYLTLLTDFSQSNSLSSRYPVIWGCPFSVFHSSTISF